MKKINLESLENEALFGSFKQHEVSGALAGQMAGGSSTTTLCKTAESTFDSDDSASQESLSDPRCSGY